MFTGSNNSPTTNAYIIDNAYQPTEYIPVFVKEDTKYNYNKLTLKSLIKYLLRGAFGGLIIGLALIGVILIISGRWVAMAQTPTDMLRNKAYYSHTVRNAVLEDTYETGNDYLKTSPITYESLLDNDDELSVYYSYMDAAYTGKDIVAYNQASWINAGFEDVDYHDIFIYTDYAALDFPILTAYQTGNGDSELRYVDDKGIYALYSKNNGSVSEVSSLYELIDKRADSMETLAELNMTQGGVYDFVYSLYWILACNITYSDGIEDTIHANDIYGALVEGESKCYGMAAAMKYILDDKNIPNFIGQGETPTGRHALNIVYIEGAWYVCDLTIGSDHIFNGEDDNNDIPNSGTVGCLLYQSDYVRDYGIVFDNEVYELEDAYITA